MHAGDRRYVLDPRTSFAVQDWGRGIWPHRSFWNWGVATGYAGDVLLGVNTPRVNLGVLVRAPLVTGGR